MTINEQLLRDEGLRLFPYTDTVGKLTIGIGRNLTDDGISKTEALFLLGRDIMRVSAQLEETWPWTQTLSDARKGAMQNLAFNLGIHGLSEFRNFLGSMEQGKWEDAAAHLLDSKAAKQLPTRYARLALQIRINQWQ